MRDRDLNRFRVELLGEIDRALDGLLRLTGESDDEVAVNTDAKLFAVLRERAGHLDGRALLDILQNLVVSRLEADDEQPGAGVGHRFERFVVAVHARGTRPAELQRLEPLAQLQYSIFPDIERVVVEKEFFRMGKQIERLADFAGNVVARSNPPLMTRQRLRPQTEGAKGGAAARRVKRHERMKKKRHVVAFDRQIPFVDFGRKRQRIELFGAEQRPRGIVHDRAVAPIADTRNLGRLPAGCEFDHGMIELAADDEVDVAAGVQALVRPYLNVGADESDREIVLRLLHFLRQTQVALESGRRRKEDDKVVVARNLDRLRRTHFVRRGIQQPAAFEHARRIGEPHRIPVRFDFACGRPTRARPAVVAFEAGRVQQQGFHHSRHVAIPMETAD